MDLGVTKVWSRFVTPAFERDYRIVLFDYVGSGKSDISAYRAEKYSNLKGYAQDILDICAVLGLKDVIFVGHSVSSMIGILSTDSNSSFLKTYSCLPFTLLH